MSIGKNCIVIGNKIAYCPDNHAIIDFNALNLSSGPALLGPNGTAPYLLLFKGDQIPQAIKMLEEWQRREEAKRNVTDQLGLGNKSGWTNTLGDKP